MRIIGGPHRQMKALWTTSDTRPQRVKRACKLYYSDKRCQRRIETGRNLRKTITFCSNCPDQPQFYTECFYNLNNFFLINHFCIFFYNNSIILLLKYLVKYLWRSFVSSRIANTIYSRNIISLPEIYFWLSRHKIINVVK